MSEEEQIAIETLKEVASDDFDTLGDDISPKMAQNILNVIEKQQKEIEGKQTALDFSNKEIIKLKDMLIEKDKKIKDLSNYVYDKEYINKDKIRELIKKYQEIAEDVKQKYKGTYAYRSDYLEALAKIEGYQELLEEN